MSQASAGLWICPWDAAEMLHLSDQTIRRYIRMGLLVARQDHPGADLHVSRQSVLDLLARMKAQVNAPRDPRKP
ncbi:MAG: helix-turn-helix domain-containing protein [Acidobacteriia bacterium]|nr:helix-turn-helix domain-containing protein [Terriglobia bacterium]